MAKTKSGRKKQRRKEVQQQKRRRYIMIGGAIGALILAFVLLWVIRSRGQDIQGVFSFGTQERGHDEAVVYEVSNLPPVGGTHSPRWQTCGIYNQPIDTKNAVHSMEHGAVWITYHPDLPADEVQSLQELVRGQSYLLLSPYPDLSSDVVLTAWGIQLETDSVTDERIAQFVNQYRLGPQTPEFGATCDGGVGIPLG